jgi:hypothetical protein
MFFRCIPEKYKQIARSIESLLDLSMMSIEEAIGRLKVVDGEEPQPLSGPITVSGKLHLTREACQGDGMKWESLPSTDGRKRHKSRGDAQVGAQGRAEGSARGAPPAVSSATRSQHETAPATTVASLAIGPRSVDSHDAVRPTSHRWRRSQLCSWHRQASSYLQLHRPQRLSSTLMSQEHTPSSTMAPAATRLTGGASTLAPPITWPVDGSSSLSLTPMSEAPSSLGMPLVWRPRASAPSSSPLSLVSTDCSPESDGNKSLYLVFVGVVFLSILDCF